MDDTLPENVVCRWQIQLILCKMLPETANQFLFHLKMKLNDIKKFYQEENYMCMIYFEVFKHYFFFMKNQIALDNLD